MVEIFICVFLLNSGLTLHNSIKIEYESRKNDPDSKFFYIGITKLVRQEDLGKNINTNYKEPPFSMEELRFIQEKFPDISVSLYIVTYPSPFHLSCIIYASEDFFRQQLKGNEPIRWENTCFMGSEVKDYKIDGMEIRPLSGIIEEKTIPMHVNAYPTKEEIDLQKAIIMPLSYYYENIKFEQAHAYNSALSIDFGDAGYSANVVATILKRLFSEHPEYTYIYSNTLEQYIKQTNELKMICTALFCLCVFFMVIIIVGLSGKSLMLINRRRKEIAVLSSFGAAKRMLCFEACAEIFFTGFISGIIGLVVSNIILFSVSFDHFEVVYSINAAIRHGFLRIPCSLQAFP